MLKNTFEICFSSYVLVMMTVDRHLAICFPLTNPPWTSKESKVVGRKQNVFSFVNK